MRTREMVSFKGSLSGISVETENSLPYDEML